MEELFKSLEFAKYRQLMLVLFAEYIESRLFGDEADLAEVKGALGLMKQLIKLPGKVRQSDLTAQMVANDLREFEVNFIKSGLRSDLEDF